MGKDMATREAYGKALLELGAKNPAVVVLDADLSKSTKTHDFGVSFPHRFFNMGIAEQNMMGTAAGLAASGKIPFCSTFAIFASGRAFEQVRNSIAHTRLNVKIAASHAGLTVGEDGSSHQSIEDIALMRVLPHMTVFVPADAVETAQIVARAVEIPGPVYIRLGRAPVPALHGEDFCLEPGKAVTLAEGEHVTLVACGVMVHQALQAREILLQEGISAGVLDMHTIKPLDVDALVAAAKKTGAVVTCEEHSVIGGLGGAVAEALAENCPVRMKRIGVRDTFGQSGEPMELLARYGLDAAGVAASVKEFLRK